VSDQVVARTQSLRLSVEQRASVNDVLAVPVVVDSTRSHSARAIVPRLAGVDATAAVLAATAAASLLWAASAGGAALTPVVTLLLVMSVPLWSAMLVLARAYETRYLYAGSSEMHRVGIAAAMTGLPVLLLSWVALDPSLAWVVVAAGALGLALTLAGRWVVRMHAQRENRSGMVRVRAVTVGRREDVDRLSVRLGQNNYHGWAVVDSVQVGERNTSSIEDLHEIVAVARANSADVVMLAPSGSFHLGSVSTLQRELHTQGIELAFAPPMLEAVGPRVSVDSLCGLPVVRVRPPELNGPRRWLKSLADRVVALVGILLLSPLLLLIALTVRLSSPGPALFTQERIGRGGVPFRMLKFRSMYVDAEERLEALRELNEGAGPLFKLTSDPRVTPFGRWLRRSSVDELPQLFNVLIGQMSLVGPRPALLSEVRQYDAETHRRLLVAPGITGLWQVHGRSNLEWAEAKRLDVRYVENWSLGFDMSILMRTIDVVVRGRGAY
jgi:exopolysaccharide biosynthesis polyprenyl glycosylphosphotransferase